MSCIGLCGLRLVAWDVCRPAWAQGDSRSLDCAEHVVDCAEHGVDCVGVVLTALVMQDVTARHAAQAREG